MRTAALNAVVGMVPDWTRMSWAKVSDVRAAYEQDLAAETSDLRRELEIARATIRDLMAATQVQR